MSRNFAYLIGLIFVLALAGCASSSKPAAAGASADDDGTRVPPNAQWTIVCRSFSGSAHHLMAGQLKRQMADAGLKGAYVVESADRSILYYGYYAQRNSDRVHSDIQRLGRWVDASGRRPFPHPMLVELDPKDPPAPPEWDLRNAKGYWSLEIAAYRDSLQRKQAAVESVRAARQMGIEAYYYQGPTISSVCIGVWPRDAVKEQSSDHAGTSTRDPHEPILVSNIPLGDLVHGPLIDRQTGREVKVFAPKVQILDPSLIAAIKKYPYHSINGEVHTTIATDSQTGRPVDVKDPSFLVVVPGAEQRYETGNKGFTDRPSSPAAPAQSAPPPSVLGIEPAAPAPKGQLKSLGD